MVETYKKEILVTEPETDITKRMTLSNICLLYTSDAADE